MAKQRIKGKNFGLPPNYADLPDDLRIKAQEKVYRDKLKMMKGYTLGDKRLKSSKLVKEFYGD